MTITRSFPTPPVTNTLLTAQQLVSNSLNPNVTWTEVLSQGGQLKYDGTTGQAPLATKGFPILQSLTGSGVAPVEFVGAGLNDATSGGTFSGSLADVFYVEIDATGMPDTFKWKKNSGSFTTGVAITGSAQTLSDGVTITFGATTGHTLGNNWTIRMLGTATLDFTALTNGEDTQDMTGLKLLELFAIAASTNTHLMTIAPGSYTGWSTGLKLTTANDQNKIGPMYGGIAVDGSHKTITVAGTGTDQVYLSFIFG